MKRTIPQIFTYEGKSYAVGLFWQPLQTGRQQLHFIERTARSLIGGGQFFCTKSGGAPQFGLGFSKRGHKKGQPVATLSIALALKDKPSTLAVFKVKQGWWMAVIRNNLILPEDDFLFEKEDDAKKAFEDLLSLPDWGYKIAPASWNISGTQDMPVGKLLDRVRSVPLQSLASFSSKYIILFALILGLGFYFTKNIFFPKTIPMQKQTHSKKFKPKKISGKTKTGGKFFNPVVQKKIEKPLVSWEKLPDFVEQATLCEKGRSYLVQVIVGWELSEVKCVKNTLTALYKRKNGSLDFIQTAHKTFFPDAKLDILKKGDTALVTLALPQGKTHSAPPVLSKSELEQRLLTFSQRTKQIIRLTSSQKKENPLQKFKVVNFSFSSKIPLREWADILILFKSVRWTEIIWNASKMSWDAKGEIYAK
ncbi:MAG: type 4b pilus protein PilO2 [Alphaproteobacteria bacterium]